MSKIISSIRSSIRKKILLLNNELPPDTLHFWQTSEELLQRLHHAGVSRVIDHSILQDALRYNNKEFIFVTPREHLKTMYYRATSAHLGSEDEIPVNQRFKGKGGGQDQS